MTQGLEEALAEFDANLMALDPALSGLKQPGLSEAEIEQIQAALAPWHLTDELKALYRWAGYTQSLFADRAVGPLNRQIVEQRHRAAIDLAWLLPVFYSPNYYGAVELTLEPQASSPTWWYGDNVAERTFSNVEHFVRYCSALAELPDAVPQQFGAAPQLPTPQGEESHFWDEDPHTYDIRMATALGLTTSRENLEPETDADRFATPYNGYNMEAGWPQHWHDLYHRAITLGATEGLDPLKT